MLAASRVAPFEFRFSLEPILGFVTRRESALQRPKVGELGDYGLARFHGRRCGSFGRLAGARRSARFARRSFSLSIHFGGSSSNALREIGGAKAAADDEAFLAHRA
jgi:hypothetical protein